METFLSDGVEIAYVDFEPLTEDRGEPIVLVHGFASTHAVNWLFTQWVKTLTEDGRRVIVFDNRGHGRSAKLYDPAQYSLDLMAADIVHLLDHLSIPRADVMGYSLGGRIGTVLALTAPERVRSLILGGIGENLIENSGLPRGLAEAMEIERIEDIDEFDAQNLPRLRRIHPQRPRRPRRLRARRPQVRRARVARAHHRAGADLRRHAR